LRLLRCHGTALLFFNGPETAEIYTLSLHDALPISTEPAVTASAAPPEMKARLVTVESVIICILPRKIAAECFCPGRHRACKSWGDRKSTRLNSSHLGISYAVFCLKKKTDYSRTCHR